MFENLTFTIIISIASLAILDSINPLELLAALFIFSIKKPISRFLPYVIGIFFFHFLVGFILYYTLHFILNLNIFNSPIFDRSLEIIAGILLIIVGLKMKKHNKSTIKTILNPKPLYTFLLGLGITASALPSSAVYFSALGIIANDDLKFASLALLLLIYNIIFVLPLFILLAIYLLFQKRSEKVFSKIRNFIQHRLNSILKVIIILVGSFLILDFILYLFHTPIL
ncbi:MAG: GAP family protein [Patescibacteria group bacterium]|jgi:cytochrome c biogenesis protein CcdA